MFDIFGYIAAIEERLNQLSRERRLAFAAWCCNPLFEESGEYLARKLGPEDARIIRSFVQNVWDHVILGSPISADAAEQVQALCLNAYWEEDDDESAESQLVNNTAVECVECVALVCEVVKSGSAQAAAQAAEKIINRIDFELGMIAGVEDPFTHELMEEELERQQQMLEYLDSAPELTADLTKLYRIRQ